LRRRLFPPPPVDGFAARYFHHVSEDDVMRGRIPLT
jgi:hypothetical protein